MLCFCMLPKIAALNMSACRYFDAKISITIVVQNFSRRTPCFCSRVQSLRRLNYLCDFNLLRLQ